MLVWSLVFTTQPRTDDVLGRLVVHGKEEQYGKVH
jgi:hypothetical protein